MKHCPICNGAPISDRPDLPCLQYTCSLCGWHYSADLTDDDENDPLVCERCGFAACSCLGGSCKRASCPVCSGSGRLLTEAAESYARKLRAQPPLPNGGAVVLDSAKRVQVVRLHEPSEPDDGWKAGALRLLDGKCPWCAHPIQNISVDETAGVTWACFEGCNP